MVGKEVGLVEMVGWVDWSELVTGCWNCFRIQSKYLEELLKPLPLTQAGMELEEGLTVFDQVAGVAALLC